ncbi:hypothetical protein Clopa_4748 [Clostridium pasteurianum BC1]|uniref:Uncharacterized protein n=1 Tax=Clostridium pasteurianum BC1 TaxID=86416 RepID=R4KFV4_CLOPA|nr:hypothetical protein Clopa_4748 [Clostridium pasteurianum BC1]
MIIRINELTLVLLYLSLLEYALSIETINFITSTYHQSYNKLKYVKGGKLVDYTCCKAGRVPLLYFSFI